jgi:hypothetical protein
VARVHQGTVNPCGCPAARPPTTDAVACDMMPSNGSFEHGNCWPKRIVAASAGQRHASSANPRVCVALTSCVPRAQTSDNSPKGGLRKCRHRAKTSHEAKARLLGARLRSGHPTTWTNLSAAVCFLRLSGTSRHSTSELVRAKLRALYRGASRDEAPWLRGRSCGNRTEQGRATGAEHEHCRLTQGRGPGQCPRSQPQAAAYNEIARIRSTRARRS